MATKQLSREGNLFDRRPYIFRYIHGPALSLLKLIFISHPEKKFMGRRGREMTRKPPANKLDGGRNE